MKLTYHKKIFRGLQKTKTNNKFFLIFINKFEIQFYQYHFFKKKTAILFWKMEC